MKKTQKQWVKQELMLKGAISRNTCLRNYISRLSAIILQLKKEGWNFITKEENGDYIYILEYKPKSFVIEYEPVWKDGKIVARKQVTKAV